MAQKVKDVIFEEFPNQAELWVHTDATPEQLMGIEGVALVENRPTTGYMVFYDPRYDVEEIKQEIKALSDSDHRERHKMLHGFFDELIADFISQNDKGLSSTTIMELMEWSFEQTNNPTLPSQ